MLMGKHSCYSDVRRDVLEKGKFLFVSSFFFLNYSLIDLDYSDDLAEFASFGHEDSRFFILKCV